MDYEELTPTQRTVLYNLVYEPSMTQQEIAEEAGCTRQHIWNMLNKNDKFIKCYRKELEKQREMVRNDFLRNIGRVHEKLIDVILDDSTENKDIINASKWYLEQSLGKATNKHEIESTTTINNSLSENDILAIFDELEEEEKEE